MSKHCQECGKLMRHERRTFSRAGGYRCINHNCPESRLFRYRSIKAKILTAELRARLLRSTLIGH